ncbi:hypothetical protein [Maricurvus nonylphenolicus]|uniref:hypothetical protein n=1 Tax=Maricurvus nonylphenolicus TaxID=1008307 RepID=UPI0036F316E2
MDSLAASSHKANLLPRLNSSLEFHEQSHRGVTRIAVYDPMSGKQYLLNSAAYLFAKALNGERNIDQAYQQLNHEQRQQLPQESLQSLVNQWLSFDILTSEDSDHKAQTPTNHWSNLILNPLAYKLPGFNPEPILEKAYQRLAPILRLQALYLGIGIILLGIYQAFLHWHQLVDYWQARFFSPANFLCLLAVYPVVKAIHELAHGLAAKHWGCSVREAGIQLLLFMPVPYMDISDANKLTNKYQRMAIAGAGIVSELVIAGLAMLAWLNLENGLLRDMAFNALLICSVSTLLFNGNPLLRFDAYYVLSDWLEIPNLDRRSKHFISNLFERHILRLDNPAPVTHSREPYWLALYGISALVYRLLLSFTIALFIASRFFIIGIGLACWLLVRQWLWPTCRYLYRLYRFTQSRQRKTLLINASAWVLGLTLLIGVIPLPQTLVVNGVIAVAEDSHIRAQTAGFVRAIKQPAGSPVNVDQPLIELSNPELEAKWQQLQARAEEVRLRQRQASLSSPIDAAKHSDELQFIQEQLIHLAEQRQQLTIYSSKSGILSLSTPNDLPGRYLTQGQVVGYIQDNGPSIAHVAVPQAWIRDLEMSTRGIEVIPHKQPFMKLSGALLTSSPKASRELPSSQLSDSHAGNILVDSRDKHSRKTLDPVFQYRVQLLPPEADNKDIHAHIPVGSAVAVRFIQPAEPMVKGIQRQIHRLWIKFKRLNQQPERA